MKKFFIISAVVLLGMSAAPAIAQVNNQVIGGDISASEIVEQVVKHQPELVITEAQAMTLAQQNPITKKNRLLFVVRSKGGDVYLLAGVPVNNSPTLIRISEPGRVTFKSFVHFFSPEGTRLRHQANLNRELYSEYRY